MLILSATRPVEPGLSPLGANSAVATPDSFGTVQLNWVHGNHLGVPLVTTDASCSPATTPNDYLAPGFPGQSRVLADLYYNRYRDYDPVTGRYVQADPVGLGGGSNSYGYAGGNPANFIDPDGKYAVPALAPALAFCATPAGWLVCGGTVLYLGYLAYEAFQCDVPLRHTWVDHVLWMAKTSRRSPRERASDGPSWARGKNPDPDENCKQFVTRLLNEKYGIGNWRKGLGSEFNKIVKQCQRGGR